MSNKRLNIDVDLRKAITNPYKPINPYKPGLQHHKGARRFDAGLQPSPYAAPTAKPLWGPK